MKLTVEFNLTNTSQSESLNTGEYFQCWWQTHSAAPSKWILHGLGPKYVRTLCLMFHYVDLLHFLSIGNDLMPIF